MGTHNIIREVANSITQEEYTDADLLTIANALPAGDGDFIVGESITAIRQLSMATYLAIEVPSTFTLYIIRPD